MRALVLAVTLLISVAAAAEERRPPPPPQPAGTSASQAPAAPIRAGTLVVLEREQVAERLERLEKLLERAWEKSEYGQGQGALRKAVWEVDALRRMLANAPDVRSYRPPPPPAPPPPPKPVLQPISDGQLERLIYAVKKEPHPQSKVTVIESVVKHQYFHVSQVLVILNEFNHPDYKMTVIRLLWPRVLDRKNAYELYEAFHHPFHKDELRKIISK